MALLEELKALGVDTDGGIRRLGGNEALYTRLLGTFVKTIKAQNLQPDFDAADCEGAIERAHAIKGTAGNMSITPLFEGYNEILALLRGGKPEEARKKLEEILPVREKSVACIESNM